MKYFSILLVVLLTQLIVGCASNTTARIFKPTKTNVDTPYYSAEIESGYEVLKSSTSVLYVPTGHSESKEHIPVRTLSIYVHPKNKSLEADISEIKLQTDSSTLRSPIEVYECNKNRNHHQKIFVFSGNDFIVKFDSGKRICFDFEIADIEVGDKVSLILNGFSINGENLTLKAIELSESEIWFQRP